MRKNNDSRQMQLNLDTKNPESTDTNNKEEIPKKQILTASVLKLSTKIEQKNTLELKRLYVGILKSIEHIK